MCASFTRELRASPAGSGLALDRIVVVSIPGPWPKPALNHPSLKPLVAPLTASTAMTRLFAGEPVDGVGVVEVFERVGLGATVTSFWPSGNASDTSQQAWLEQIIDLVAGTPLGAMAATTIDPRVDGGSAHHSDLAEPVMLVCTQGSHDTCCGVHGETLAQLISTTRPQVQVRRVSHTGGHRFAPTAMALPHGRMWAWIDAPLLDRILDGAPTADDLSMRCRGWWGVAKGRAQVAEIAARIEHEQAFVDEPSVVAHPKRGPGAYEVTTGSAAWLVDVAEKRTVPTIACEAPGGLPVKQSVEYGWTITSTSHSETP